MGRIHCRLSYQIHEVGSHVAPFLWSFHLFPYDGSAEHHSTQFTVGEVARQELHAAIRGDDQALWRHVWQGGPDALSDDLR